MRRGGIALRLAGSLTIPHFMAGQIIKVELLLEATLVSLTRVQFRWYPSYSLLP